MLKLTISIAATVAALAVAMAVQLALPELPPFVLLFPAIWLAAFLGGPAAGAAALFASLVFVVLRQTVLDDERLDGAELLAMAVFAFSSGIAIAIVHLYRSAAAQLDHERLRLQAALKAANAAVWEINPEGELFWDENFYHLVGLDRRTTPPTTENFLAMVHPEDRERMAAARRAIDAGKDPSPVDTYRLIRPSGETVWLENHRTRLERAGTYFIGITQNITRRKLAEEKVQLLLREATHRAKNQFAVIQAIARETMRSTGAAGFDEAFSQRISALARSHDLLVKADWSAVELVELIEAHLKPFGAEGRATLVGPSLRIAPSAAQSLGMAFHELSTNAVKYGALSVPEGRIEVTWSILDAPQQILTIIWQEEGGPPAAATRSVGFGTSVLLRLVPRALSGEAELTAPDGGLRWRLAVPYGAVVNEDLSD